MEHWIYTFNILNHSVSINLDTVFTMWFAMGVLIIFALLATKNLSIVPNKIQAISEAIMKFFFCRMKMNRLPIRNDSLRI